MTCRKNKVHQYTGILRLVSIIMIIAVAMSGCGSNNKNAADSNEEYTADIFAMDTYMTLTAYGKNSEEAVNKAIAEINRLDRMFSVGNTNSDVTRVNNQGSADVTEETAFLINMAVSMGEKTNGAYDVTIYPIMELWGFTTKNYNVPEQSKIEETLKKVSYKNVSVNGTNVQLSGGSMVDLGGIAKGYTSSRVMEIFKECGIEHGIINLGGNVQVLGDKTDGSSWRVAVQNPDNENGYLGILSTTDNAVITSGGYERYFEQNGVVYHHIIDPDTGYPSDSDLTSVTIVCADGTTADALSTGLFVMGLDKAKEFYRSSDLNFDMILYDKTGTVYVSEGIKDNFTTDYTKVVITK